MLAFKRKFQFTRIKKISPTAILSNEQFEWLVVLCCQLIFVGFVCSRALVSIGMISLLVASLLFKGILPTLKKYAQTKELWILSLYLIIVLISGIYSDDKNDWLTWVRIKLPFFALPLAFAPISKLSTQKVVVLLYGFILTFFMCTSLVLANYFMHYESMTQSFTYGTQIPMPYSHIRYTLMLAFSFFCAIYLLQENLFLLNKNERWLQLAYALFVFIALHILSVRSGLLALYLGILYLALYEIFKRKQVLVGAAIILLIAVLPFAAVRFVPSLHNKIGYMNYDLSQYKEGKINDRSDAMRLVSMKIGLQIWHENPILGVGAGDLETETNKIYDKSYPEVDVDKRRTPHNQFIWVLATTGIVGLSFFLIAFFLPLLSQGYYKYGLILILHLMLFSSFFTEDTFEEQMGSGFYLIFLLILMNYFKRE